MSLWDEYKPPTAKKMVAILESLFESNETPVSMMTIHRAKGLENKNIVILNPPIEHPLAKTKEEKEQETNLKFVATRS